MGRCGRALRHVIPRRGGAPLPRGSGELRLTVPPRPLRLTNTTMQLPQNHNLSSLTPLDTCTHTSTSPGEANYHAQRTRLPTHA